VHGGIAIPRITKTLGETPIAVELHPEQHEGGLVRTKSNCLRDPRTLSWKSDTNVHWICPVCDHYYWASPNMRNGKRKARCNACARKVPHRDGHNCMAETHPRLAEEFDNTKNLDLTHFGKPANPRTLLAGTHHEIWWKCWVCSHSWKRSGKGRSRGQNCPACANREINNFDQRNSMSNTHPELAADYDTELNDIDSPSQIVAGVAHKLHWKCSKCGERWKATGNSRMWGGHGCRVCAGKAPRVDGVGSLGDLFPDIAKEFHETKNIGILTSYHGEQITPYNILPCVGKNLTWLCSNIGCGNEWVAKPLNRIKGNTGCPDCAETGFDPKLPAFLYLLAYECSKFTRYKIGITNQEVEVRKYHLHRDVKFSYPDMEIRIIYFEQFKLGSDAQDKERWFMEQNEHRFIPKLKFDGYTEMYLESIVEVWESEFSV